MITKDAETIGGDSIKHFETTGNCLFAIKVKADGPIRASEHEDTIVRQIAHREERICAVTNQDGGVPGGVPRCIDEFYTLDGLVALVHKFEFGFEDIKDGGHANGPCLLGLIQYSCSVLLMKILALGNAGVSFASTRPKM